jgi:hypothetical protein
VVEKDEAKNHFQKVAEVKILEDEEVTILLLEEDQKNPKMLAGLEDEENKTTKSTVIIEL